MSIEVCIELGICFLKQDIVHLFFVSINELFKIKESVDAYPILLVALGALKVSLNVLSIWFGEEESQPQITFDLAVTV